jgi:Arc/MetJ-type ribon-helix-helix transcriptional regulator
MEQLTITLPKTMKQFIDQEVQAGKYDTPDALIADLINDRQLRRRQAEVDTLLLEAIDAEAPPMTKVDWDELKRRVLEVHAKVSTPNGHPLDNAR